jgi:hypothetical protein
MLKVAKEGKGKREGQCMDFFNTVKEKKIQAGWVTLQSAFPFVFGGGEKHEAEKKPTKQKKVERQ